MIYMQLPMVAFSPAVVRVREGFLGGLAIYNL